MLHRLCFLIGAFLISTTTFAAHRPAPKATVQSVFVPATINSDVDAFVKRVGRPEHISGPIYSYTLQGCHLELLVSDDGTIDAMGVDLTGPRCAVDLGPFLLQDNPLPLAGLTFGQFVDRFGGEYRADCLTDCVLALDPRLYVYYQGFLANHHIDVRLSSIDSGVGRASWGVPLAQAHGKDYLKKGTFNCDPASQSATAGLAAITITRVDVGMDLDPGHCPHDEH